MEAGVGSVLVVPFGRRRVLGVVVETAERSDVPAEKLVEPIEALEGGVPPELVRLGPVDRRGVRLDAGARAVARPPAGHRHGRAPAHARAARAARGADARPAATRSTAAGGSARSSARRSSGSQHGPLPAALIGHGTLRRLEARGLVAIEDARVERRPEISAVGARGAVTELTRRAGRGGRAHRGRVRRGRREPAAARRDRQRQDRGLPARRRARARARPVGDRARARDRADAADRRAVRAALRRPRRDHALEALGRRALRRVDAAARAARRASAWARARPSSRRSPTSG